MGWGSFTTSWASAATSGYSGSYVVGQTQTAFGVLPSFSLPSAPATAPAAGAAPTISLNQPVAEYGRVIPISMGTRRLPPQLIWAKPIYGDTTAGFFADFAVAWGFNGDAVPGDTDITVLWANGIKIWDGSNIMPGAWSVTLYSGTATQTADATIVAAGGAATGYRGVLYGVFSAFPIGSDFNYGIPGISAEVVGSLGSANAATIEELINTVGDLAGLDSGSDIAVDAAIDDVVDGAVIATETTFDDFSLNLGKWFGFDRFEGGSTINFIRPVDGATYTVDATIPASAVLNDAEKGIATTRGEDDSPILLSGGYIDQTQQFRYSTQRARRILFPVPSTRSTREMSIAVPVVLTANEAISYLGQAIYRMAQQNVVHTFKLPPRYLYIEPGDILSITAASVVYTVKVTKVEIGPDISISVAAVNLYTDEIISLEGDSGSPLPGYEGDPAAFPDETPTTISARYWRIKVDAYTGFPALSELYFAELGQTAHTAVTAIASSTFAGQNAAFLYDNDPATWWGPTAAAINEWVGADFGAAVDVNIVRMRARGAGQYVQSFTVEYSADNISWSTAWSVVNANATDLQALTNPFPNPNCLTQDNAVWRLKVTAVNGATTAALQEIELRSTVGGVDQTSPSTYVWGQRNAPFVPELAFDNNTGTVWASTNNLDAIGVEFTVGKSIAEIALTCTSGVTQAPNSFNLQRTGDGLTWVTELTVSGESGWSSGETRTFAVP